MSKNIAVVILLIEVLIIPFKAMGTNYGVSDTSSIIDEYGDLMTPENEIIYLRTADSQHWKINDTTNVAIIYSQPKFFMSNGVFEPISNKIIKTPEKISQGYCYRNEANDIFFYLNQDASKCLVTDGHENEICEIKNDPISDVKIIIEDNICIASNGYTESRWIINSNSIINKIKFIEKPNNHNAGKINWLSKDEQKGENELIKVNQFESIETIQMKNGKTLTISKIDNVNQDSTFILMLSSTTLNSSKSGRIYKASSTASPLKYIGDMLVQNMSSTGCSYGYRGYVKYNLSSIPDYSTITRAEPNFYVLDKKDGLIDKVTISLSRLSVNPETSTPQTIWNGIYNGTFYEYDNCSGKNTWTYSVLNNTAKNDITNAIISDNWYSIGLMVKCDENDSDYFAKLAGYQQGANSPYMAIKYDPPPEVTISPKYKKLGIPSGNMEEYWTLVFDGNSYSGYGPLTVTTSTGSHSYYGKVSLGDYTSSTKTYTIDVSSTGKNDEAFWNKIDIKVYEDNVLRNSGYSLKVNGYSQSNPLNLTIVGEDYCISSIDVTWSNSGYKYSTDQLCFSNWGISDQKFYFYKGGDVTLSSPENGSSSIIRKPTFKWNSASNAYSYHLKIYEYNNNVLVIDKENIQSTQYTPSSDLKPGTTYKWKVSAKGTSGVYGAYSDEWLFTTEFEPVPPENLSTSEITQTSFKIKWDACDGATEYRLDVSKDSSFSSKITGYDNKKIDQCSATISGLESGTRYYWRIKAIYNSQPSNYANGPSIITIPPNPVALDADNISYDSFRAKWQSCKGATKYYLDVSMDSNFTSVLPNYNNKEIGNVTSTNVTGLQKENDYYYRVRSYNESGTSDNSNVIHVTTPNSIDLLNNCIPDKYFLYCNFPNPFNPTTSISYDIPEKSNVKITILDISGRVVENLVDKTQEPGHYQISWDASGHPVGVYLYRITAGQFTDVKKCILLK